MLILCSMMLEVCQHHTSALLSSTYHSVLVCSCMTHVASVLTPDYLAVQEETAMLHLVVTGMEVALTPFRAMSPQPPIAATKEVSSSSRSSSSRSSSNLSNSSPQTWSKV